MIIILALLGYHQTTWLVWTAVIYAGMSIFYAISELLKTIKRLKDRICATPSAELKDNAKSGRNFSWAINRYQRAMLGSMLLSMIHEIIDKYSDQPKKCKFQIKTTTDFGYLQTYVHVFDALGNRALYGWIQHYRYEIGKGEAYSSDMEIRAYLLDKYAFGWDAQIFDSTEKKERQKYYAYLQEHRKAFDRICQTYQKAFKILKIPVNFTWQTHEPLD